MMDFSYQNYINHKNSAALINMINGIEGMILKAPDSDKKEMLLDVLHFSKEVAEGLKTQCNSFQFINTDNLQLEIKLGMEKTNVLEEKIHNTKLRIENKKLKSQIKEMLL